MSTTHPRLHQQVQLVHGMDDAPLALHRGTGTYHRLSPAAAGTLRLFDGSRSTEEVAGALAAARHQDPLVVRAELDAFLDMLARAGLLDGAVAVAPRQRRNLLLPRFVVTRSLPRLLEPPAAWLRGGRRARICLALLGVAGILGFARGLAAFVSVDIAGGRAGSGGAVAYVLALVLLLVGVCVHESMHALVCQVLGVPIRGAGFALLAWVIPVAYVDRTDAYRVRGRGGRVALALSGPLLDGVVMGATGLVALSVPVGLAGAVAAHLLTFQAVSLVLNMNPLLPSDIYVAAEAAFGLVDVRGRAFTLIWCLTRRRPLPPHLTAMSARARWTHVGYGVACAAYLGLILYVAAYALVTVSVRVCAALLH